MSVICAVCEPLLVVYEHCIFPDARRVPLELAFRACVLCLCLVVAFSACALCLRDLYHTTKALLTEYLTSYTNTSQLIDYQYSI